MQNKEHRVKARMRERERERDVGIICVIIYDDLALKAWTQRGEREREREREDKREFALQP